MMATNFDYFLAFYRKKIQDGEKQIDLAESPLIKKSTAYINKLFRGNPKSCPIETQRSFAEYYKVSYDEMIEEGRQIYIKNNPVEHNSDNVFFDEKTSSVEDVIKHLNHVISVIKLKDKHLATIEKKAAIYDELMKEIRLYKTILSKLDEGVTFFDKNRELVFTSNRWGFLDGINVSAKPSIEVIVLGLRKKISNFEEVLDTLFKADKCRKEMEIDVSLFDGKIFTFKVVPIYNENMFIGSLVINKLKAPLDNN